jgi:hypothetical protein
LRQPVGVLEAQHFLIIRFGAGEIPVLDRQIALRHPGLRVVRGCGQRLLHVVVGGIRIIGNGGQLGEPHQCGWILGVQCQCGLVRLPCLVELFEPPIGIAPQHSHTHFDSWLEGLVGRQGLEQLVVLLGHQQCPAHGYRPTFCRYVVCLGVLQVAQGVVRITEHQRGLPEQQPGVAVLAVALQDFLGLDVGRAILSIGLVFDAGIQARMPAGEATSAQQQIDAKQRQAERDNPRVELDQAHIFILKFTHATRGVSLHQQAFSSHAYPGDHRALAG